MYYLGYVLIPPTNLDSLIWHDSQHLFHFWQIEYWVREDSCKVEYWDLADLHHGIEPNLKERDAPFNIVEKNGFHFRKIVNIVKIRN